MAQRTIVVCQVHTAGATLALSDRTLGEFISEEQRRHEASRSERARWRCATFRIAATCGPVARRADRRCWSLRRHGSAARVEELEREKATLEAFAAVAAHELVEPLIMTEAFAAHGRPTGSTRTLHADSRERPRRSLGRTATRMRHLLEALLHDARSGEHSSRGGPSTSPRSWTTALPCSAHEIEARGATVRLGELPTVPGDEALLNGLFTNLLLNALKYSPRRGARDRVDASRERRAWRRRGRERGPDDPAGGPRSRIFEPLPARPQRAPRARRRPRPQRSAAGSSSATAAQIGVVPAARRRQPLLLHAAGLTAGRVIEPAGRRRAPGARVRRPRRASWRRACA